MGTGIHSQFWPEIAPLRALPMRPRETGNAWTAEPATFLKSMSDSCFLALVVLCTDRIQGEFRSLGPRRQLAQSCVQNATSVASIEFGNFAVG